MLGKLIIVALALVVPALGHSLPYIVGGSPVSDSTMYPWQGSISTQSGTYNSGCALISSRFAVTAARLIGTTPSDYLLRFGSVFRHKGGVTRTPVAIIRHENYGIGSGHDPNDIAVMSFYAVPLSSTLCHIKMASSEEAGNSDCWISGWGYTYNGDGFPPVQLQEAHITVYTQSECIIKASNYINNGHVCAGDAVEGIVACWNDHGGPLVCEIGGAYQLVGVSSWYNCDANYPSVYTRISYFRAWVTLNTGVE